jgi:hypothetical protein
VCNLACEIINGRSARVRAVHFKIRQGQTLALYQSSTTHLQTKERGLQMLAIILGFLIFCILFGLFISIPLGMILAIRSHDKQMKAKALKECHDKH